MGVFSTEMIFKNMRLKKINRVSINRKKKKEIRMAKPWGMLVFSIV